jgi:hypothetical protein
LHRSDSSLKEIDPVFHLRLQIVVVGEPELALLVEDPREVQVDVSALPDRERTLSFPVVEEGRDATVRVHGLKPGALLLVLAEGDRDDGVAFLELASGLELLEEVGVLLSVWG